MAKVEELTRQLEELRRGRTARDQPPASALELDKLRRELMVSILTKRLLASDIIVIYGKGLTEFENIA